MLFNSYLFLFGFLPACLAAFFIAHRLSGARGAKAVLAIASIIFYAYARIDYVLILFVSILANYTCATAIIRLQRIEGSDRARCLVMAAGIVFDLLLLGYFKYFNFFVNDVLELTRFWKFSYVELPVGISFFTFTQIAFLVDARKGKVSDADFLNYILFVTFFPHLIAGPILHHSEMMPQFDERWRRAWPRYRDIVIGLTIFSIGLAKKVVFADTIATYATPVFAEADAGGYVNTVEAWIAALSYTLQLYFDFSGYSDMAIGLSRLFGVKMPLNFFSPYKAKNIIEFWRRWHMTLSRFLRDYVYIPLGGNRKGRARRYVNLYLTMLIGGLWHGAGWTFVAWGSLHGVYLLLNHFWQGARQSILPGVPKAPRLLNWLLTFIAVVVAWVFFRAKTFHGAIMLLTSMFTGISLPANLSNTLGRLGHIVPIRFIGDHSLPISDWPVAVALIGSLGAIALLAPNTWELMRRYDPTVDRPPLDRLEVKTGRSFYAGLRWRPNAAGLCLTLVCAISALLCMSRVTEFLYYQF